MPIIRARGQALVELAIALPLLLLLLVGVVDIGRLFYTYIAMENAAREGAAFGMLSPADTPGDLDHEQRSGRWMEGEQVDPPTLRRTVSS